MFSITPSYLFTSKGFVKEHTIIFDKKIIACGKSEDILQSYPDAVAIKTPKHSMLIPGFINTHVHLEFSANTTHLKYGRFMPWLYSVIAQRDHLSQKCEKACLDQAINSMLHTGTTTFAAVSSFGTEMQACIETPAKVVYFNELIGSNAAMADALWGDFLQRLDMSKTHASETFFPAIAIHSPYSVHPILIKRALEIARNEKLLTTAHLLESDAERQWLEESTGEFAPFFENFLQQKQAVNTIEDFIKAFDETPTLFTHATKLSAPHAKQLQNKKHTIIHCPVSNRLLGNGALNLKALYEYALPYVCATDGLSSNISLNILDELKAALFMHHDAELDTLALSLLHSVTTVAGEALRMPIGKLDVDYAADFQLYDLHQEISHEEDLALHLILGAFNLQELFINGTFYKDLPCHS